MMKSGQQHNDMLCQAKPKWFTVPTEKENEKEKK